MLPKAHHPDRVDGRRAGLAAAVLLNATLLFGVGSVIMTPDTPLLVFWTACLWALARLVQDGKPLWWLVAGVFAGLAMASKYTAALLWLGIALWVLVTPSLRHWLRQPAPWLGAALAMALVLPVAAWNAAHDWASFARQGGRFGDWQPADALRFLGELIAGQLGLLTPLIAAFCAGGVVLAAHRAWRTRAPAWTLLSALTLPAVVLFTVHALGDRVQGNWPAIIYPAAGIAAGGLESQVWQRLRFPAVALGFGITILIYLQASLGPLPLTVELDPTARQLAGWEGLARRVDAVRRQQRAEFVAVDQYGVAAELARALGPDVTVVGAEPRWTLLNLPRAELAGRVGILVRSVRRGNDTPGAPWSNATKIGQVERTRGAQTIDSYRLYRVTAIGDAAALPHPATTLTSGR